VLLAAEQKSEDVPKHARTDPAGESCARHAGTIGSAFSSVPSTTSVLASAGPITLRRADRRFKNPG
jgi:hypothetical protein